MSVKQGIGESYTGQLPRSACELRIEPGYSKRNISALKHQAIPLVPKYLFLYLEISISSIPHQRGFLLEPKRLLHKFAIGQMLRTADHGASSPN